MRKSDRYFMNKGKNHIVIKVGPKSKKGFAKVVKGLARGVDTIGEHILEEQYLECSFDHYKRHIKEIEVR
jgi:hypothetical protein